MASWWLLGRLGVVLAALGLSWRLLGLSGGRLGGSWAAFGGSWGSLGGSWGALVAVLAALGPLLAALEALRRLKKGLFDHFWLVFEAPKTLTSVEGSSKNATFFEEPKNTENVSNTARPRPEISRVARNCFGKLASDENAPRRL